MQGINLQMIFPAYCWILKYYEWSLLERNANGHAYGTLCWSWQVHAPLTLSSKLYFFRRLPFGKLIFPPSHTTAFRSRLNICKIKKKKTFKENCHKYILQIEYPKQDKNLTIKLSVKRRKLQLRGIYKK